MACTLSCAINWNSKHRTPLSVHVAHSVIESPRRETYLSLLKAFVGPQRVEMRRPTRSLALQYLRCAVLKDKCYSSFTERLLKTYFLPSVLHIEPKTFASNLSLKDSRLFILRQHHWKSCFVGWKVFLPLSCRCHGAPEDTVHTLYVSSLETPRPCTVLIVALTGGLNINKEQKLSPVSLSDSVL